MFLIPCLYYLATKHDKSISISVSKTIYKKLGEFTYSTSDHFDLGPPGKMLFELLESDKGTLDLAKRIVKGMPVEMSDRLHEDMVSRIGEIFNNAYDHSSASHVIAGRYPKPRKKLCFVCYDTGIGIPDKVRDFLREGTASEITDEHALRWAMEPFNTTVPHSDSPRGLGLGLLRDFIHLNRGRIRICTGNVLYTYDCGSASIKENFQRLNHVFYGTLFEMDINTDDRPYRYKGE